MCPRLLRKTGSPLWDWINTAAVVVLMFAFAWEHWPAVLASSLLWAYSGWRVDRKSGGAA